MSCLKASNQHFLVVTDTWMGEGIGWYTLHNRIRYHITNFNIVYDVVRGSCDGYIQYMTRSMSSAGHMLFEIHWANKPIEFVGVWVILNIQMKIKISHK